MTGLFVGGFYFGSIWDRDWLIRGAYFALGAAVMFSLVSLRTSVAVGFDYYIRTISEDPGTPIPPAAPDEVSETAGD